MKRLASNLLIAISVGLAGAFFIRIVLRAVLEAMDRVDDIAQRQAARHAYGPLVSLPRSEGEGEALIAMAHGQNVTGTDDEIANHQYAPGMRPWDDQFLDQLNADPLSHTIDDPYAEDGVIPQLPTFGTVVPRGGHLETET